MRKSILLAAALLFEPLVLPNGTLWSGDKIKTPWADQVDPQNPLPEYPRPLMERDRWQNLNGLWDYAIVPVWRGSRKVRRKILCRSPSNRVFSRRSEDSPAERMNYAARASSPCQLNGPGSGCCCISSRDRETDVWVNDVQVGRHTGGYTFRLHSILLPR